jgi:hypothetical protein
MEFVDERARLIQQRKKERKKDWDVKREKIKEIGKEKERELTKKGFIRYESLLGSVHLRAARYSRVEISKR